MVTMPKSDSLAIRVLGGLTQQESFTTENTEIFFRLVVSL